MLQSNLGSFILPSIAGGKSPMMETLPGLGQEMEQLRWDELVP